MKDFIFRTFGSYNCLVRDTKTGKEWEQYTIFNRWYHHIEI